MRKFIDSSGTIHHLFDSEIPQDSWVEVVDQYKRYTDQNGDIHTILSDATPGEGWVENEFEYTPLPDPSFVPPYDALRRISYPEVANQLDMLWHEIKNSGSISTSGEWYQTIDSIKNQFPKE